MKNTNRKDEEAKQNRVSGSDTQRDEVNVELSSLKSGKLSSREQPGYSQKGTNKTNGIVRRCEDNLIL